MTRISREVILLTAVLVVSVVARGQKQADSRLFDYGDQYGDQSLPISDDASSPEFSLSVPFIFYGQTYSGLFVNTNGFISFLTEIPSFFNVQFPLDYPIIAAFYSDVDTTVAGTVWFRETTDPSTVSKLQSELRTYFRSADQFNPTSIFIATWDGVGGHKINPKKVNTYQIILASDGRESYVVILYEYRGLQWLRGKGKNPSLPDAIAQAGFISGDGRMTLLKGSGRDQVRNLHEWSNVGEPGVWVYRVGQIQPTGNVVEPDDTVPVKPEDQDCQVGGLMCHSKASCVDYSPGFCCQCPEETFGNGVNCIKEAEPLRVTGKVSGDLNGVVLLEADLHSYVLTPEGRTYTAVSRIPKTQGYDMQILIPISTGITWLFSKPMDGVPNGFTLTGGIMNRTVTVDFPQTGHSASVQQTFVGLDVFENVEVKTFISGTLPTVPHGSKIEIDPFTEEYTRVKPGQLRARSNRVYRLQGQQLDTPFIVETTIDFDECSAKPAEEIVETLRLKVSENIFIQYDAPEKIVRFAISSVIGPLSDEDPCLKGREQCGPYSQCVVDGDTYRCVCNRGYEQVFDPSLEAAICVDKNECATGRDQCSQHATCTNTPGSFSCTCQDGYTGDGYRCEVIVKVSCEDAGCHPEADCRIENNQPICSCPPHLTGDGYYCLPLLLPPPNPDICGDMVCSPYAKCAEDAERNARYCACHDGYSGDGIVCTLIANRVSCDVADNCDTFGTCQENPLGVFTCVCLDGFTGDGYTCRPDTGGYHRIDTNYGGENILPIPVDQIPDYILGSNYSHIPVEFGSNPYDGIEDGLPYGPYVGLGSPLNHSFDQSNYNIPPYTIHSEDHQAGANFDKDAIRPAVPVDQPHVPSPYLPPQRPQEPLQPYYPPGQPSLLNPYQPSQDRYQPPPGVNQPLEDPYGSPSVSYLPAGEAIDPECALGTCFCPAGYKFHKFSGKCVPQSLEEYIGEAVPAGSPEPYCSAAKCTCPDGYIFNRDQRSCDVAPPDVATGSGNPVPDCSGGRFPCYCPPGFYFQFPENTCEPRTYPGGEDEYPGNQLPIIPPNAGGDFSNGFGLPGSLQPNLEQILEMLSRPNCDAEGVCTCNQGFEFKEDSRLCELLPPVPREGFPTPECIRGQFPCHCPEGYFFEFPQNTCEPRGPGEEEVLVDYPQSHGGGLPYPYPGGHLGLGEYPDYFGTVDARPQPEPEPPQPEPECFRGTCLCPTGFYYLFDSHACLPTGNPSYRYDIKGGGAPSTQHNLPDQQGGQYPQWGQYPEGDQNPSSYPDIYYSPNKQEGQYSPFPQEGQPSLTPNEVQYPPRSQEGQYPPRSQEGQYPPRSQEGQYPPRNQEGQYPPNQQTGYYPSSSQDGQYHQNRPNAPRNQHSSTSQGVSCNLEDVCHEYATCIYEADIGIHLCKCNPGFAGNGIDCVRQDFSCDEVNICHVNAQCVYDDLEMRSVCVCLSGYVGDGTVCAPEDECNTQEDCDVNAQCGFDSLTQRFRCSCNAGYTGDGSTCVASADAGCNIVNTCHHHADCVFDTVALTHRCQCRSGYEGDGTICTEIQLNCNVLQNCGQFAQCLELAPRDFRCVCRQGYTGDGYYCQPTQSCQQNPAMCNQFAACQPDPASNLGYSCQCQRGYIGDGFTCMEAPTFESNLLLLNRGLYILRMPVDANAVGGGGYPITVDPYMSAVGSDIDCFAGRYIWTDVRSRTIRSSNYDGTERRPMVSGGAIASPEDVAIDWISRNLYWTDSELDEIVAASLDGDMRRTIISKGLVNPRGIAVHPGRGLLFWSDWNREAPKIESSGMDGSDRRVLVDDNISLPNGLVIDYETSTLCWGDAGTDRIECIGLNGRDRRTVIKGPKYPFGLTLHGHHFFYTDWEDQRIHVVNKYTGREEPSRPPPPGGSGKLYGITAVPDSCPPVSNACQMNRGGCPPDMLCLPNGFGGRICACPSNVSSKDGEYQGCTDIV